MKSSIDGHSATAMAGGRNTKASVAILHHGNQLILTDHYPDRPGIHETATRFLSILKAHEHYQVPLSLQLSGTLIEALAWAEPGFLEQVRGMCKDGFVELVGSCYGQNVMRFFGYEHNLRQLNEQLALYRRQLGVEPEMVKVFWPTERVWDTELMAPVLRDPRLLNGGYHAVVVDDRTLLSASDRSRADYDRLRDFRCELLRPWRIRNGRGLIALPIATTLRECIPPRGEAHQARLCAQLDWAAQQDGPELLSLYADDMEKPAGLGWDQGGPAQFDSFLRWLSGHPKAQASRLGDWAEPQRAAGTRTVEPGAFFELAHEFGAGESYERWYHDPAWAPHRAHFDWAEARVAELSRLGADPALIGLAHKQLLVSTWETAWHTPPTGPHGDPRHGGAPSPWIKALASHSRHAAVTAEAAYWATHCDEDAHAYLADLDGDGEKELVLKNDQLFAVFTPRWGGRLIYLFALGEHGGAMMIGNPCDDWNLQEELNRYMDSPRNHPGAFGEVGFEHDQFEARILATGGGQAQAALVNVAPGSGACGLSKRFSLARGSPSLQVDYALPGTLAAVEVEFGLSPDYLSLLRDGQCCLPLDDGRRGTRTPTGLVWIDAEAVPAVTWTRPPQEDFGHGRYFRLSSQTRSFALALGIELLSPLRHPAHRRRASLTLPELAVVAAAPLQP